MVTKVVNFTEKSFKNYTGPDAEFKLKNIVFGYNGRGKSSLANGIIKEFMKDASNSTKNYRFFNRSFMERNLDLKESENPKIRGVVANFGEKDVNTEKQIEVLNNQIVNTTELEKEIERINNDIRKEINRVHDSKKGKVNISRKSVTKTNEEVLKLYLLDLENAKRIEKDEEKLKSIQGDNSIEKKKNKIEKINIPKLNFLTNEELEVIEMIFKREFNDLEIPSSIIIDWIEHGVLLHQDSEKCLFCGNKLNIELVKLNLAKYNHNEKQKNANKLKLIYEKVKEFNRNVEVWLECQDILIECLECENACESIENSIAAIKDFEEMIKEKIIYMENKIEYDFGWVKNTLDFIFTNYTEILSIRSGELSKYEEMLSKFNVLVKGAIGLEIKNNTFINENMKIVKEKEKNLMKVKEVNDLCRKQIEELKKSKSNTKDFADHITSVLKDLGINLKLDLEKENYVIKHAHTSEILSLKDISEGEQNLLSLLYFYYELYEDKEQTKLKDEIKLIVVDDPVASMDDINKMYVLELVKRILELKIQIFVFTHVWEDFCDICYNKKDNKDTEYRILEIKKDSNGSRVENAPTNETPYKHNFKEIYEFSRKKDANNLTECEIYHYPNIMRKILEEYLHFKVKNALPTLSNIGSVKTGLCKDNLTAKDEVRLRTLLDVCNVLSHKSSRNPDEILNSAKFLMRKIEETDEIHYNTMKS